MSASYLTPNSLAFRADLAKLVSPLRRVRSRSPFFRLAAHRIPTLWSLYRGLLRNSPTEDVKFRVRLLFRRNKHLTGLDKTRDRLLLGYKWLDFFNKAKAGDAHCQEVLRRFSRLIAAKRRKARMWEIVHEELESQKQRRNRPIFTGGFIRPTLNHVPLPRMKPQPPAISGMIVKRIIARRRRQERKAQFEIDLEDLTLEERFEEGLRKVEKTDVPTIFSGTPTALDEWKQPILESLQGIHQSNSLDFARASTPYRPELVAAVLEARRRKIYNKTREKDRERRGEVLKSTLKRQRKGPPAHILAKMSPERREMDKVSRSLSEVGYVALVKRRLGFKLKDPEAGLELGEKENRPLLDQATAFIRAENRRREMEQRRLVDGGSDNVAGKR
ncbi:hypothetical protein M413DRAFT_114233 [Hebeloma cylindrosporum]|uniref:Uncharacterized protein n=1 Tax=Hebeloma cylindrosporum TaxID=76867 RepID=A0A0C3CLX0_HEBCY|nr:hypothetical protein M413DRAFT_114233 [Hebeloma cylindrosporum h7]